MMAAFIIIDARLARRERVYCAIGDESAAATFSGWLF